MLMVDVMLISISGEWPIERYTDINTVCDLLKSWFRVLPGGMFPSPAHKSLMDAAGQFVCHQC